MRKWEERLELLWDGATRLCWQITNQQQDSFPRLPQRIALQGQRGAWLQTPAGSGVLGHNPPRTWRRCVATATEANAGDGGRLGRIFAAFQRKHMSRVTWTLMSYMSVGDPLRHKSLLVNNSTLTPAVIVTVLRQWPILLKPVLLGQNHYILFGRPDISSVLGNVATTATPKTSMDVKLCNLIGLQVLKHNWAVTRTQQHKKKGRSRRKKRDTRRGVVLYCFTNVPWSSHLSEGELIVSYVYVARKR